MDKITIEKYLTKYSSYVIVLLPILGYLNSYFYELGNCQAYGIPVSFISINTSTILNFGSISFLILGLLTMIALQANFYLSKEFIKGKTLKAIFILMFFFVILISLKVTISNNDFLLFILIVFGLIAIIAIVLITTIAINPNGKFEVHLAKSAKEVVNQFYFAFFLLIIVVMPTICMSVGIYSAKQKDMFFVTGSKKNIALIEKYDDLLICKYLDLKTKRLTDSVVVMKISDQVTFKPLFIAPLADLRIR